MNSLTQFWSKAATFESALKGIIYTKWHPGCSISSLSKQLLILQMKCCRFLCRLCLRTLKWTHCSCSLCKHTHIVILGAQRRLWLNRLRWQRRYALRLASTQLGPMLCCSHRGNAGKVRTQTGGLIGSNRWSWLWTKMHLWEDTVNSDHFHKHIVSKGFTRMKTTRP